MLITKNKMLIILLTNSGMNTHKLFIIDTIHCKFKGYYYFLNTNNIINKKLVLIKTLLF